MMIEVTDAAAEIIGRSLVPGKVLRMFLAAIDATGANYGLALGAPEKGDTVFKSNGVELHMFPQDAEFLKETVIDYVSNESGTGFIIRGPLDEPMGCGGCASSDSCGHDHGSCDHGSCDHDHGGCGHHHGDDDCGCC